MHWRHIVKVKKVRRGSSIPAMLGRSQRMWCLISDRLEIIKPDVNKEGGDAV